MTRAIAIRHTLLAALVTLYLILPSTAHTGTTERSYYTCNRPIRIMPLGDSITQGAYSLLAPNMDTGYRLPLYESLNRNGYYVDFVGSQLSGWEAAVFDYHHEGHPGVTDHWYAEPESNGKSRLYNLLTQNPPDIILMHIGTNARVDADPGGALAMLDEIQRWENDHDQPITVLLARIINRGAPQHPHAWTTAYNSNVAQAASQRISSGDNIILVDMENGAGIRYADPNGNDDMWDAAHPNAIGYQKMAPVWYNALVPLLPQCVQFTSVPITITQIGTTYVYDVNAVGNPPPVYSFPTDTGFSPPPGMTIDPVTGIINWTPDGELTVPVEVQATSGYIRSIQKFVLEVGQNSVYGPRQPAITIISNQGRPTVVWTDDPNSTRYMLYIGTETGYTLYLEQFDKTATLCDGQYCRFRPDINPWAGNFVVYLLPQGPGGVIANNQLGWVGPTYFAVEGDRPAAVTELQIMRTPDDQFAFSWEGTLGATWYQVWIGTLNPLITYHTDWYLAEEIGCENGGRCTITPHIVRTTNTHYWFVRAWGPGGFSYGGTIDGWTMGSFTP